MTGPLSRVLASVDAGAGSLADVARRTGLSTQIVRASVDHLVRIGRLDAESLGTGCAGCTGGGCGGCPLSAGDSSTRELGAGEGTPMLRALRLARIGGRDDVLD